VRSLAPRALVGVSAHSLYRWLGAITPDSTRKHAIELVDAKSEILRLRAQLRHYKDECDIYKKSARYFVREPE